jgi:hypothetical protein
MTFESEEGKFTPRLYATDSLLSLYSLSSPPQRVHFGNPRANGETYEKLIRIFEEHWNRVHRNRASPPPYSSMDYRELASDQNLTRLEEWRYNV